MNVDLHLIASVFEKSANRTEVCARRMNPNDQRQRLIEVAAVRECVMTLRTPGIGDRQALEAITVASRACVGSK